MNICTKCEHHKWLGYPFFQHHCRSKHETKHRNGVNGELLCDDENINGDCSHHAAKVEPSPEPKPEKKRHWFWGSR